MVRHIDAEQDADVVFDSVKNALGLYQLESEIAETPMDDNLKIRRKISDTTERQHKLYLDQE